MALNFVKKQWKLFLNTHPLKRGMITYAVLWPTANLIRQTFEGKNLATYDWKRALRFSIFGCFYVAPTLYCWVTASTNMWPESSLRIAMTKAIVEQISYGPFGIVSFYMGTTLLEFKSFGEACEEVRAKFLPTYKAALCYWPIIQTINFSVIPEHNRVVFVSFCGIIWTTFLAYMKSTEVPHRVYCHLNVFTFVFMINFKVLLGKAKVLFTKYPLLRGMVSYSFIWPTSSIIQQTFEGKRGDYDWWRVLRFSIYGGLFVAPTLYSWIKISSAMWPAIDLQTAIVKAAVEQISYTPAAMTCFFFIMSLLEMKTIREAAEEVSKKFLPTYKVGLFVWFTLGTVNFWLIPEKNRVPFISVCSLLWTCFLAYMKHLEHSELNEKLLV